MNLYTQILKRPVDILIALFVLLISSPLFLITWIILLIQNGGKAFFIQERPGKHQKPFQIIKFKTMNDKKDSHGNLLSDVDRLTPFGRTLRMLSLDELPQLFNVLNGEMSMIGPRPLLYKYILLYSKEQIRRHEIRPGITGWAQVNGRNSISWTRKFKLDIYYVDHLSFALDFKILVLTIKKVWVREGINQAEDRPMEPFNGKN